MRPVGRKCMTAAATIHVEARPQAQTCLARQCSRNRIDLGEPIAGGIEEILLVAAEARERAARTGRAATRTRIDSLEVGGMERRRGEGQGKRCCYQCYSLKPPRHQSIFMGHFKGSPPI